MEKGWVYAIEEPADDQVGSTIWAFAPANDPAYPAVIKRVETSRGGKIVLTTTIRCEASPHACADLKARAEQDNGTILKQSPLPDLH